MMEIGNENNAKEIFKYCKKIKLNIFSQMIGWKLAKKISQIPKSHKEGSVFLTLKRKMNWSK